MSHFQQYSVSLFALLWVVGGVCAKPTPVSVRGTDTATRCLREVAWELGKQAKERKQPLGLIKIAGGGSRKGIEALCAGQTDIAVLGIPLDDRMKASLKDAFPDGKPQPREVVFSQTALMLVVHKNNPRKSLTPEQLRQIFSGEITDWKDVGGRAGEIKIYIPGWAKSSTQILRKQLLSPKDMNPKRVTACRTTGNVIAKVVKDKNGLGYFLAPTDYEQEAVQPLGIQFDPGKPAVYPTTENVLLETYPAFRKITLLIHPKAPKSAHDFVHFACSPAAAEITHHYRFYPANQKEQVLAAKRLAEMKTARKPMVVSVSSTPMSIRFSR